MSGDTDSYARTLNMLAVWLEYLNEQERDLQQQLDRLRRKAAEAGTPDAQQAVQEEATWDSPQASPVPQEEPPRASPAPQEEDPWL